MKENTKYHDYRFVGKTIVDEMQPWFDFASGKQWDEGEIPWVLDNKARREILIKLAEEPKSFENIFNSINFTPEPLIIKKEEHQCTVSYQWTKETLENHLLVLEWYNLIEKKGEKYQLLMPLFSAKNLEDLDSTVVKVATSWLSAIKDIGSELKLKSKEKEKSGSVIPILIEKVVEKLYGRLKNENLIANIPNSTSLWAEQLRKIKYEDWVEKNF